MNLYQTLLQRGYLYQSTDEENIPSLLSQEEPFVFYMGIDPTADSLHIGHFFALMMFRYLQEAGHKGILVVGGATALIGDPTGKSDLRKMLSYEDVARNIAEVKKLAEQFINVEGDNPAIILNNADWINPYGFVDFLRDIGVHFNVNTMLNSDAYSKRLEQGGLTFLEMGYMLMQSYDFEYLNQKYNCILQIGGSDQWGNIAAGVSLHRKLHANEDIENIGTIYGITCPLLTTSEGKKMGKTEKGTLWVARDKTTVWDFFQYFYNVGDENTENLLRLFTKIPLDEIKQLVLSDIRNAKRIMAYEITCLVHGKDEANKVLDMAKSLFDKSKDGGDAPTITMDRKLIIDQIDIVTLLYSSKFVESKSEARRLISQGGISMNGEKITEVERMIIQKDLVDESVLLKKGKKHFLKIIFE